MEEMELVQPAFTLIFNVVMITSVTSLALICRFLRRDNQKLMDELTQMGQEVGHVLEIPSAEPAPVSMQHRTVTATAPVQTEQQDIRGYVANRKRGWVAPLSGGFLQ